MVANHPNPATTARPRVRATTRAFLLHFEGPRRPVVVETAWHQADPLAIELAFRNGRYGWVTWTIAVELLRDAFTIAPEPAGDGDVRITCHNPAEVRIELASPAGRAVFAFDHGALADLLQRIDTAHPPWQPLDTTDLDTWIAAATGSKGEAA